MGMLQSVATSACRQISQPVHLAQNVLLRLDIFSRSVREARPDGRCFIIGLQYSHSAEYSVLDRLRLRILLLGMGTGHLEPRTGQVCVLFVFRPVFLHLVFNLIHERDNDMASGHRPCLDFHGRFRGTK